jgi:hypothetical protein
MVSNLVWITFECLLSAIRNLTSAYAGKQTLVNDRFILKADAQYSEYILPLAATRNTHTPPLSWGSY